MDDVDRSGLGDGCPSELYEFQNFFNGGIDDDDRVTRIGSRPSRQRLLVLGSSQGTSRPGVSEMHEKVGDRRAVYEIRSLIPDIHGVCPGLVQRRSVRIKGSLDFP